MNLLFHRRLRNVLFLILNHQLLHSHTFQTRLNQYNSLAIGFDKDEDEKADKEAYVLELKVKALILDTIHQIAILEELLDVNVTKINEWSWQKQLR